MNCGHAIPSPSGKPTVNSPRHRGMRIACPVVALVVAALVSGCTGKSATSESMSPPASSHTSASAVSASAPMPANSQTEISSCGIPFRFTASDGKSATAGGCSGSFGPTATTLAVRVGTSIHLDATHEQDGSPDFPIPVPRDPRLLALTYRTAITADYLAQRTGTTVLDVTTIYCSLARQSASGTPVAATCPALIVTVTP